MEDDELTRARRALRGVDPELDLTRVYAESRARAHGADARGVDAHGADAHGADVRGDWAPDERVEVVLRDATSPARPVRALRPATRRGRVLVWGAAATAATALAVGVGVVNAQAPRTAPGSVPSTGASATPGPMASPSPEPTFGLTPAEVVDRAARAVADASCGVRTRSSLGDESTLRFDGAGAPLEASDTGPTAATPGADAPDAEATHGVDPAPLGKRPLAVLEDAAVDTVLGLSELAGADYHLHDELHLEEEAGQDLVRVRLTPPDGLVDSGLVTRIDLLVDTTSWLPHSEETWARSDAGQDYLLYSEFSWTTCDGSSSPSAGPGFSR